MHVGIGTRTLFDKSINIENFVRRSDMIGKGKN